MRIAVVLVAVLGCACGRGAAAPAWPKLHAHADDGGESLAPHVHTETAAALEGDPHPAPRTAEVPIAPIAPPAADPGATPTTVVAPEDTPLLLDDTVIEINEDSP